MKVVPSTTSGSTLSHATTFRCIHWTSPRMTLKGISRSTFVIKQQCFAPRISCSDCQIIGRRNITYMHWCNVRRGCLFGRPPRANFYWMHMTLNNTLISSCRLTSLPTLNLRLTRYMSQRSNLPGSGMITDFRVVVGTLLVVRNPLSPAVLSNLLTFDSHRHLLHAISRLGCVLYTNAVIRILHPSFADFLSNRVRCKMDVWFIDLPTHNLRVIIHCMGRLDGFLECNVGDMDFPAPADVFLPEDVSYACVFWIEHVCIIKDAFDRLEAFLFKHLLHWFEAMSILKRSRDSIGLLSRLRDWHNVRQNYFSYLFPSLYSGRIICQTICVCKSLFKTGIVLLLPPLP